MFSLKEIVSRLDVLSAQMDRYATMNIHAGWKIRVVWCEDLVRMQRKPDRNWWGTDDQRLSSNSELLNMV